MDNTEHCIPGPFLSLSCLKNIYIHIFGTAGRDICVVFLLRAGMQSFTIYSLLLFFLSVCVCVCAAGAVLHDTRAIRVLMLKAPAFTSGWTGNDSPFKPFFFFFSQLT